MSLKVCDPACGSGHFLIAAAHRIANRLAAIRTGDEEPSPEATRTALRDVIGRCLYGVDVNPMAVELCKVNLWLEALEPGKPLSFLEHHVQCGNSLLGATPALLKKGIPDEAFDPIEGDEKEYCKKYRKENKKEREGRMSLFQPSLEPWNRLGDLATALGDLDAIKDDTLDGQRAKQERWERLVHSQSYEFGHLLAEAWCAAFVWKKAKDAALPYPITEETFRRIEKNPHAAPDWMRKEVRHLADEYQFFHWHLAFPDVFRVRAAEEEASKDGPGWIGGFDVVLGNPPWEVVLFREQEFFAKSRPDIAQASTGAARARMIERLRLEDPVVFSQYRQALRRADATRFFLQSSGRYPLTGRGRTNTYGLFAETCASIMATTGYAGLILPTGIATDDSTKLFFQHVVEGRRLASLFDFENRDLLFPTVHRSAKFSLITFAGGTRLIGNATFLFFAYSPGDITGKERRFFLTSEEVALLNPNTKTCPSFRSRREAELVKGIYREFPILWREEGSPGNLWSVTTRPGLFNMTADSALFRSRGELEADGYGLERNILRLGSSIYLPLYEGKMFSLYDHRFAHVVLSKTATIRQGQSEELSVGDHKSPDVLPLPRHWVSASEVEARLEGQWSRGWLLGWKEKTSTTNERTLIATIFPRVGIGHTIPIIVTEDHRARLAPFLGACLASVACDFVCREKLGSPSLTPFTVKQLAVIPPDRFTESAPWSCEKSLAEWMTPRVIELLYTAWDLHSFAVDLGWDGSPFRWDLDRRFMLRCELDAAFFHLYGIARDDADYIMDTFPIVRRKDEKKLGDYRTKLMILDIYDRMQKAIEGGQPYQTILDPPPADPRCCHPPRTERPNDA